MEWIALRVSLKYIVNMAKPTANINPTKCFGLDIEL